MQISRHWRLNAQRYRLEGFRNPDGRVSLQPRPVIQTNHPVDYTAETQVPNMPIVVSSVSKERG